MVLDDENPQQRHSDESDETTATSKCQSELGHYGIMLCIGTSAEVGIR
jgi:hypothetical protein